MALTGQVPEGDSLLVVGASGAGKTSLLRAIAGLWSAGSGTIRRYLLRNCLSPSCLLNFMTVIFALSSVHWVFASWASSKN